MNFENIKKEFPVTDEVIFFDHARVAPLPERVRQAVITFINNATQFGTTHYDIWMQEIERTRKKFAHFRGKSHV